MEDHWKAILEQVQSIKLPTDFPKGYAKSKRTIATSSFSYEDASVPVWLGVLSTLIMRYSAEENIVIGYLRSDKPATLVHVEAEKKPTFEELCSTLNVDNLFDSNLIESLDVYYDKKKNEKHAKEQMKQLVSVSFSHSKDMSISDFLKSQKLVFPFDKVTIHFHLVGNKLEIQYKANLFLVERIQEMFCQIKSLLTQGKENPKRNIYDYTLLTTDSLKNLPDPLQTLSQKWEGSIHEHFEKQAAENPDKIAIIDHENLTYKELNSLSNQLARHLHILGLKQGETVGIYGHRSAAMVWAIMSILKAGGNFTIVDPVYPAQRIIDCLSVASPSAFLLISAAGHLAKEVAEYIQSQNSTIRFLYEVNPPKQVIASKVLQSVNPDNLNLKITEDDVAVCTFTSGSTGLPKAVAGRHGPLTHYYPWMTQRFKFTPQDRFSMQSGIAHDPLQRDIFTPLFLGATIYIPDPEQIQNPGNLALWFKKNDITVTCLTPAMGQLLASKPPSQETILLPDLRWAFFVGDVLTKKFVGHLSSIANNCGVINMYGSTETQRSVSYFLCPNPIKEKESFDQLKDIIPIGMGMGEADIQIIIVTRHASKFQLCGIGEMGEIYMRSPHLSKGYKGKEEETAQKFIINPMTGETWDKMYRTGDLGRYLCSGDAICLGRADDQIKIRGFRIELGEINCALNSYDMVKESVTIVRTDIIQDEKMLVSYVVLQKRVGTDSQIISNLKKHLRSKLPIYMIPSAIVIMEVFPLTPNAKIKREALPKPTTNALEESFVAPRNDLESKLVEIWSKTLALNRVGVFDNFFDLGGHSILATTLVVNIRSKIEEAKDLPVETLYKCPTIAAMAEKMMSKEVSSIGTNPTYDLMKKDCVLDNFKSNDVKDFEWSDKLHTDPHYILLTGSTGFLGTFLLADLLKKTTGKIYCLVRSDTKENAAKKIVDALKHHLLYQGSKVDRIVPIVGDFAQPLLGLSIEEYNHLAKKIDVIIHNGALVHWMYPYEKLRPANVGGTREVIQFACTSKIKPIHYVSTTSVFDSDQYSKWTDIFEGTDLPFQDVKGGYPQSKLVAEKLIMAARTTLGIPTCIYRPGYITGHSKTGVWNPDDFLCRMIKGCIQLEAYPDLADTKLDMSPVDFVAEAIVELFKTKDAIMKHKAYHLVNPNEFFFNSLFTTAERLGYTGIERQNYLKWKTRLFESIQNKDIKEQNALYPMLTHFTDDYDIRMKAIRPWYDNTNTLEGLMQSGISCPSVIELLGVYYGFLCQCGFLGLPKELSGFAKQKKYFEFAKSLLDEKEEAVDYRNLMRKNRIDSTDQLSEY